MLKPVELSSKLLTSADEHKRSATNLRRLSGGLEAQREGAMGLTDKEKLILTEAVGLLNRMATVASQAAELRKKADDAAEARRKAIKSAYATTFGRLSSVSDKVALIGAVQSSSLRSNPDLWAQSKSRLDEVFVEALDTLAWALASKDVSKPAAEVVSQAWETFQGARAGIEDQHAHLIVSQQRMHGDQSKA